MVKTRILAVDDTPSNLELLSLILGSEGYEVATAGGAEEMLAVLGRFEPDLILLDIRLPGVDGYGLARRLKASETTRHVPIIAVTACAMPGDEAKSREAGCSDHLTKPVRAVELLDSVRRHLHLAVRQIRTNEQGT